MSFTHRLVYMSCNLGIVLARVVVKLAHLLDGEKIGVLQVTNLSVCSRSFDSWLLALDGAKPRSSSRDEFLGRFRRKGWKGGSGWDHQDRSNEAQAGGRAEPCGDEVAFALRRWIPHHQHIQHALTMRYHRSYTSY